MTASKRPFNSPYSGEHLDHVAFPLGGIGAGMICIEGTGALSHVSLRHAAAIYHEPCTFAAICIRGDENVARVLEGPVPMWKAFAQPGAGNGLGGRTYGLPRFRSATFEARFPFAEITLRDQAVPLSVRITPWSPFIPGDSDSSSLPVAALEYTFSNEGREPVEAVFSFNTRNFMAEQGGSPSVRAAENGFVLAEAGTPDKPWQKGEFLAAVMGDEPRVNCRWFRGGWWDPLQVAWKQIQEGVAPHADAYDEGDPSPGAGIGVPFSLGGSASKTISLLFAWHIPVSNLRVPADEPGASCDCRPRTYAPWYASCFNDVEAVAAHWREHYSDLRSRSEVFRDSFHDTTLPPEVVEAVAANMTILKSPTVLRQQDGRLWAWEGCHDAGGCCPGSCTHVWNYAQAIPHLFPDLERSLRETEFHESQNESGHQQFRSTLPIRPSGHEFHAAADGQLGGVMKVHREWRISGDTGWLKEIWPRVRQSLDYCIETWDPEHRGITEEPHHNTYDIEFWGPDGMCTSFYLGALRAAIAMGEALGEDVALYGELLEKGRSYMDERLYNGEYYFQIVEWEQLRAQPPAGSPEAAELLQKEGPKYQYGDGCLSDGVLGAWIGDMCGVPGFLDTERLASNLAAIHRYNFKPDLSAHSNPQRPTFALGAEGGLVLCSWPRGNRPTLPFVYSDEVWTGIEYQVASHLMVLGMVEEGLEIVRAARARYDGRFRNPFNEYECGHWYARAMSSYGLIQALTGIRYDAVEKVLYVHPSIKGDFRSFLSTAGGFGVCGVRGGQPFLEVRSGSIEVERTDYRPFN